MKSFNLIIGAGTIGGAIADIMKEKGMPFEVKDKEGLKLKSSPQIMHICFPYSKNFVKNVANYVFEYRPGLTIINSTVLPGTTKKIIEKIGFSNIVYSPVIGDHNVITKALKTFTKIVAYESSYASKAAEKHFSDLGIKIALTKGTEAIELNKILLTSMTALNIAYMQEVERMHDKIGSSWKTFNEILRIYNQGYEKMRPAVRLPDLFPGVIGGTCLMPNIEMLKSFYKSGLLKEVEKSNKKKERDDQRNYNCP